MFTRFRALPDEQLQRILQYVESGKPIVGLRTSTHAFLYPEGHPRQGLNDGFGRDVFGQKWITHHGNQSSTDVAVHAANARAPHSARRRAVSRAVVAVSRRAAQRRGDGAAGRHDGQLEQDGQIRRVSATQPVAWTRQYKRSRVFFTTLGHPDDFAQESMRRLLINAIYWAWARGARRAAPTRRSSAPTIRLRRSTCRRCNRGALA